MPVISLRDAVFGDADLILQWRNDPFIVARSSSRRLVTFEEHRGWFLKCLKSETCRILIIVVEDKSVGQVRFDRMNDSFCVISAYMIESQTGKGFGVKAVLLGCRRIFDLWDVDRILAYVRSDNWPAQSCFRKVGFVECGDAGQCPEGHIALTYARPGDGVSDTIQFRSVG